MEDFNRIAGLLRDAILRYLTDIAIDKGLGSPEFYNVYVREKENTENNSKVILNIEGSISEFGVNNPLRRYVNDRIGFDQWNADISEIFDRLLENVGIEISYLLTTKIDPIAFEMKLEITK